MEINKLRKFLIASNKAGYAAGNNVKVIKEKDGSKTITHKDGDWMFHDNYFGGEPYGGREVIFYKNKPVWMMVYYGKVDESAKDIDKVYKILQEALMKAPSNHPYRGPAKHLKGEYVYKNSWKGEVDNFSGNEVIVRNGKAVYEANYIGGIVDKRS